MISSRNGVIKLRKAGLSYAEIGRRLNISRERARQICNGKPSLQKASVVMLTTSGAAQLLGVHPNTVRSWANRGILKSCRIGPRADRRFRREDIWMPFSRSSEQFREKNQQHGFSGPFLWTDALGELTELLYDLAVLVAEMESQRRSERTKAGLARVRREGKAIGRPKGSKDSKKKRELWGLFPGAPFSFLWTYEKSNNIGCSICECSFFGLRSAFGLALTLLE